MTTPKPRRTLPASLALSVLAVALLCPAAAHPQDQSEYDRFRERFDGTWALAVPQAQAQQTVDAAINQAVDAMNFFVRGVARPMLRDNTPLNRTIVLDFQGSDRIRVRFPDTGWETTTRVGRTERARSQDGESMRVTQRFGDDGALEQVFQADQGTRWNVFRPRSDGTVVVESTVQGTMMPQPMRFSLRYRRR